MSQEDSEAGPLAQFLAEDHRRLDALLQSAAAQPAQVNREVYDQFRAGLLRHIGLEEKILFPAVLRWTTMCWKKDRVVSTISAISWPASMPSHC